MFRRRLGYLRLYWFHRSLWCYRYQSLDGFGTYQTRISSNGHSKHGLVTSPEPPRLSRSFRPSHIRVNRFFGGFSRRSWFFRSYYSGFHRSNNAFFAASMSNIALHGAP